MKLLVTAAMAAALAVPASGQFIVESTEAGDVPTSTPVKYSCTFNQMWRSVTHPIDYPSNAMFSPMVLVSHSDEYTMWEGGIQATTGVQTVAETGDPAPITAEIMAAGDAIGADVQGMPLFNANASSQVLSDLAVDADHPLISVITMLAPSPDWFTGFFDFNPADDSGNWYKSFNIETWPWDAGTDSGDTFMSEDVVTDPQENIFQLTVDTVPDTGVFLNPDNTTVLPVAGWDCSMVVEDPPFVVNKTEPSDIPVTEEVEYTCTFIQSWRSVTHPIDYPSNAMFSPMVLASHSDEYTLWETGILATMGVQTVAETGDPAPIKMEIAAAGDAVGDSVQGMPLFNANASEQVLDPLTLDEDHPYVSVITMLAPSPDWFTGFFKYKPVSDDGTWYKRFVIDTYPFDSGTDDGDTFLAADAITMPPENVFQLTVDTVPPTGIFLNPDMDDVYPVASWDCKIKPEATEDKGFVVETTEPSDIPKSEPVDYTCTFIQAWRSVTHPVDYPSNAMFSPMVLASHNADYTLWEPGVLATTGVYTVAETGDPGPITDEIMAAGDAVGDNVQGGPLFNANETTQVLEDLSVDKDHPYVSAITMLAPSPDWFTGFYKYKPVSDDGKWYSRFVLETFPFDSGTDSGETFLSDDVETVPQENVFQLTVDTVPSNGIFLNPDMDDVYPVAMWDCSINPETSPPPTTPSPTPDDSAANGFASAGFVSSVVLATAVALFM